MYPQYPNQPNQPNQSGSNPPNQYPAYPNNVPGSGPQQLRPDPYPPAPQQPSGPYAPQQGSGPYAQPPAGGYPPTQPSGLYPPPQPQPGQPGAYPPTSGYPPYGGAPSAPFAAPPTHPLQGYQPPMTPTPPQRSGSALWIIIASVVGVALIVAIVATGLILTRGHGTTPQTNISPTATSAATTAPTLAPTPNVPNGSSTFTDDIPSCDNPGVWQKTSGAGVTCNASTVTVANPVNSHTIAEIYFNASGTFAARYDVAVQLTNLANGCGGISVLEQQAASVVGYVCSDGSWQVVQYSAAGTPSTLLKGQPGSINVNGVVNLDVTVAERVFVSINGTRMGSVRHPPNQGTDSIGLVVASFTDATSAATADFDTFQYSPL